MPSLFRHNREESVTLGHARRYFWYALGEVVLIFVGITLALAFGDMQERRRLHEQEISTLRDIAENLKTNVDRLAGTIAGDEDRFDRCQTAISVIEQRLAWRPDYGDAFEGCRYWSSPYFRSAAYDSLKVRGTDLISNRDLRLEIVILYEDAYAQQIGDIDREQWELQASVLLPVWNRYFRDAADRGTESVDFDSAVGSSELDNLLHNRSRLLRRSLEYQRRNLELTRSAIASIDTELERLANE